MTIAWWGWLIIWVLLVLALVGVLALSAWRLFRKAMTLLDEVSRLAEKLELLDVELPEHVRPAPSVLATAADIRSREDARRTHRLQRRIARHERRIARATRVASVDIATAEWPVAWRQRRSRRPL